jgi:hypothetical protein
LCDLRGAKLDELREAGELAWKVKELMHDLLTEGDQALRWRLAGLVEPPLSQEQITLLIADLAPSTVRVAQEKWLPGLYQEIAAHRAGAQLPAASPPASIFNQPGSVRWLIDDADCSLQYLPRRHTDLFLQNWLDLAGREYATSPRFARLFDALASPYAPGRCTKCHSVEARPDGSRFVHWKPAAPEENVHAFTTFVHQPHFNLFEGQRCDLCHTLAAGSGYAAGFVEPDNSLNIRADRFSSNFESIARGTCAACHSEEKAGESCLLCHSYHVGTFSAHRTPAEPRPHARRRFGRPGGS